MARSSFSALFAPRKGRTKKRMGKHLLKRESPPTERATFTTGKLVRYDQWDKVKQQVKGKTEEAISINLYLQSVKNIYKKEAALLDRGLSRKSIIFVP